ncbi:hypothetical protein C1H46_009668 [Malus baccata]|uniref:Uncharacterized protein n=1 Tax=Malus baccata TaxID=106549 RepID=A0A540N0Y1_MALBA|nr:hypothetical protein C1H46_009668 [Malus baccata]
MADGLEVKACIEGSDCDGSAADEELNVGEEMGNDFRLGYHPKRQGGCVGGREHVIGEIEAGQRKHVVDGRDLVLGLLIF